MKLNDKETLIKKGSANHLMPFEGVGGKLFLTNQRLFFRAHFFNIQTHEESIPLEEIVAVEARGNGLFFRMISILLKNGSVERFIVRDRKIWVEKIKNNINVQVKKNGQNKDTLIIDNKIPSIPNRVIVHTILKAIIVAICIALILFFIFMVSN